MQAFIDGFQNIWVTISVRDVIDVLILAVILYQVLLLTRQSRAISVLKGLGVLLVAAGLSEIFRFQAINWLLAYIINAGPVVLVVLFAPEFRRMMESLGQGRFLHTTGLLTTPREENQAERAEAGEQVMSALRWMSRQQIGCLVVVERENALTDIINSGTAVDAQVTAALLENIFYPNTPLHDGAVIMRANRVVAAGCLLPLTQRMDLDASFGTRHRAALGMSETSDAVCFVVSEETGFISITEEGRIQHNVSSEALEGRITELFGTKAQPAQKKRRPFARRKRRA